jgi:Kef-type K+ transport system membrane component KefB
MNRGRSHFLSRHDRRPGAVRTFVMATALLFLCAQYAFAALTSDGAGHAVPPELLWIPLVLLAAKLSSLTERIGQPAVLGELVMGVALGNLVLIGFPFLEPMGEDPILAFLAQLGVIVLLFQIGLESSLDQLRRVGGRALAVAAIGVVVPFAIGAYLVGPVLLPGQSTHAYLFMGAAMTATSVGITARVFRDLGKLNMPEAQIVLGAAVIDDVLGLVILAVVSALVTAGTVSAGVVAWIIAKSFLFLAGALVLGRSSAPIVSALFSRIQSGAGMKLTLAMSMALIAAWVAGVVGLAPIVGAFAAGLVLEPVYFSGFREPEIARQVRDSVRDADATTRERVLRVIDHHSHRHIEDLIEPIGHFLVPIFFVLAGMAVDLRALFDVPVLLVALGLTIAAFLGKIVAGAAAGPGVNRWLIGWGMVPRGEVGLIFATIGRSLGAINEQVFSVIVLVVIFSTLLTPPVLGHLLRSTESGTRSTGSRQPAGV